MVEKEYNWSKLSGVITKHTIGTASFVELNFGFGVECPDIDFEVVFVEELNCRSGC